MVSIVLEYLRRASCVCRAKQETSRAVVKADSTVVTEVDLELSELAVESFSEVVHEDCVLTEEHQRRLNEIICSRRLPDGRIGVQHDAVLDSEGILVIVDPIDGTRNYVNGTPLYGVSVGVYRDDGPWIGGVAFPALGEVMFSDGEAVYFSRDIVNPRESAVRLMAVDAGLLASHSVVMCTDSFPRKYRWMNRTCGLMMSGCSTINLCWTLLGRSSGALFGSNIWDIAGAWPFFETVGYGVHRLRDGAELKALDWEAFDSQTKRIKEYAIVCRSSQFESIKSNVEECS